jgi:hypothetical protein
MTAPRSRPRSSSLPATRNGDSPSRNLTTVYYNIVNFARALRIPLDIIVSELEVDEG